MEIKEITVLYKAPQMRIIELSLGSGSLCTGSTTEKLEEDEGAW